MRLSIFASATLYAVLRCASFGATGETATGISLAGSWGALTRRFVSRRLGFLPGIDFVAGGLKIVTDGRFNGGFVDVIGHYSLCSCHTLCLLSFAQHIGNDAL